VDVNGLVLCLLGIYALALLLLSRGRPAAGAQWLLDGRRLTLPAFVATLVTTWYGGILGVGEYAWRYGISTWLVFGVPYYLAAVLFGVVLAPRLRAGGAVSIPDLLKAAYGPRTAILGGAGVWALTVPAAYVLMLGVLLRGVTGWPLWLAALAGATFSSIYVGMSGFRAVVRTDALQLVLMYGGFAILLPVAVGRAGGLGAMWNALPAASRSWDGGMGLQFVLVWYLIALQTMVEPAFYQRVFAARSPRVARRGILLSVAMWAVFDFMTTFTGLAARVLLPGLSDPVQAYPELARLVLPALPAALFTIGLFATVMSSLDSYLFLAAATAGHDLALEPPPEEDERRRSRWGLAFSAAVAVVMAAAMGSVVEIWHHVGSVVTSALLLPVLSVHLPPRWRFAPWSASLAMAASGLTALAWILARKGGSYPLGLEPMFPALAVSVLAWMAGKMAGGSRCKAGGGEP